MKWILIFLSITTAILITFMIYESIGMPGKFEVIQFNTTKEEVLIGVISDTHIPRRAEGIPLKVKEIFKNVDLIVHAGDIVSLDVIEELERIAPVIAIYGNMDPDFVRGKLSQAICIKVYDWRIGVIHNSILPWVWWKMRRMAEKNNLDILIFGHTHRSFLKEDEVLMINPGSPTDPIFSKASVALLKVSKDSYEGKIVFLD